MRRYAIFLPPVLALATFIACDDSGSSGGDGGAFTFDGGNFEASTPLPPPPPGDSGFDAAETGPLPVTVVVTSHGKPVTGIAIIGHDATGAVVATNTTGADGRATFIGVMPSMVSALLGIAGGIGGHEIVTWLGVQPGDVILAQDVDLGGAPVGIYDVSLGSTLDGGNFYNGNVGECGGSGPPLPFQIYVTYPCVRPSNSVLVSGFDTNGNLLAYASKRAAPAVVTDGGGTTPVTVGAWTAPSTTNVIVANVPPNGGSGFAHLFEIADDNGYDNQTAGSPDGSATPFATPTGFADALQGGFRFQPNLAAGATQTVSKRTAVAPTLTVDLATALPAITGATLDTSDLLRPSVTLQASGSLATADGGVFFVAYSRPGADFPDTWLFITPPGTTTLKAPAMPTSAAPWLPGPDAGQGPTSFRDPYVFFLETDTLPSYTEFRQGAGLLIPYGGAGTESKIVLPKNGNLRISSYQRPN